MNTPTKETAVGLPLACRDSTNTVGPVGEEQLGDLLPEQAIARARLAPVQALMLAVLEDAALCYSRRRDLRVDQRRLARQAESWLRTTGDQGLFCFESVCHQLSVEPDALRKRILALPPRPSGEGRHSRCHRVMTGRRVSNPRRTSARRERGR